MLIILDFEEIKIEGRDNDFLSSIARFVVQFSVQWFSSIVQWFSGSAQKFCGSIVRFTYWVVFFFLLCFSSTVRLFRDSKKVV